jgi:hypothetical protein
MASQKARALRALAVYKSAAMESSVWHINATVRQEWDGKERSTSIIVSRGTQRTALWAFLQRLMELTDGINLMAMDDPAPPAWVTFLMEEIHSPSSSSSEESSSESAPQKTPPPNGNARSSGG